MKKILLILFLWIFLGMTSVFADENTNSGSTDTSTGSNMVPEAMDDEYEAMINTSIDLNVLENDTDEDGDELSISDFTDPENWVLTLSWTMFTYAPNTDFEWEDEFEYTITDSNGWEDTAEVQIEIYSEDDEDDEDEDENENNEDEDENNEDEDGNEDDDNTWEKHWVKNLQKEYIAELKALKEEYKWRMWNKDDRKQYLDAQKQLRNDYKNQLKEITWQWKKTHKYSQAKKNTYKKALDKKYKKKVDKMSDEQLERLLDRIDTAIERIEDSNMSDTKKEKYIALLVALQEVVEEKLNESEEEFDLDSLFEE